MVHIFPFSGATDSVFINIRDILFKFFGTEKSIYLQIHSDFLHVFATENSYHLFRISFFREQQKFCVEKKNNIKARRKWWKILICINGGHDYPSGLLEGNLNKKRAREISRSNTYYSLSFKVYFFFFFLQPKLCPDGCTWVQWYPYIQDLRELLYVNY